MIPEYEQCRICKYRRRIGCAAFPSGIPDLIALDVFDHRQPYPGDHGIRWEPNAPGVKHPQDNEENNGQ